MYHKRQITLFLFFLGCNLFAQEIENQKRDTIQKLDEVIISAKQILGSKFQAKNRTGSAYYISPIEIQKMGYTDINRMLKAVPGVNVYEEDGYGLRPNISLRGTKAERSEKITLMEDGILASPAPYASPAAYYFPNAARMSAVEVLKGSSQVQYGPFTTGGAINMVSTPIPSQFSGKLNSSYGTNNTYKAHFNIGESRSNFGYLVEYLRYQSDGFKKFEDGQKAGFKRNDFIAKFVVKTDKSEGVNHSLEMKFGYADEDSDETYVGLSEADFKATPFLRYAGSRMDNINTNHQQWALTYLLNISPKAKVTTNLYYNKFHRNWYKLNDVRAGITPAEKRSIGDVLKDPQTNHLYFDIMTGAKDYLGEALIVRANNRDYLSRGVQTKAEYKFEAGDYYINTEAGLRYHADQEDRFQWDDGYSIENKQMKLFVAGIHGEQANRINSAEALALHLLTKVLRGNWTLTAGLRYEDILLHKKDYTKADLRRTGHLREEAENKVKVLIPSLGINYKISPSVSVFSGVHKGFSPPSVEFDKRTGKSIKQDPESSINFEAGTRISIQNNLSAELIGFYNNYSNMLGSNLAASGGTGDLNQFDIGEAIVKGAEFLLQYNVGFEGSALKFPLQFSYTYTDTEIQNSFREDTWGYVFKGDEIPYINKHSLNASIGVEYKWLDASVGIRYNGDVRTTPGQGVIASREKIPAHTVIDASARARLNRYLSLSVNVVNLTNETYLVSRHPSGLRPGHPFGISTGITAKF